MQPAQASECDFFYTTTNSRINYRCASQKTYSVLNVFFYIKKRKDSLLHTIIYNLQKQCARHTRVLRGDCALNKKEYDDNISRRHGRSLL